MENEYDIWNYEYIIYARLSLFREGYFCEYNIWHARAKNKWRVSSQNALYPFLSIWDIWDLSCWNIKKIIRKFVILLMHNFKNIPLYIMSNVSLERYYFVLYDGALTLKMAKMALNAFCDKTLQVNNTHQTLVPWRGSSDWYIPIWSDFHQFTIKKLFYLVSFGLLGP